MNAYTEETSDKAFCSLLFFFIKLRNILKEIINRLIFDQAALRKEIVNCFNDCIARILLITMFKLKKLNLMFLNAL